MIKFEGISGLRLDWLISQLVEDLRVDNKNVVKSIMIQAIFDLLNYDELLDRCADLLAEQYEEIED